MEYSTLLVDEFSVVVNLNKMFAKNYPSLPLVIILTLASFCHLSAEVSVYSTTFDSADTALDKGTQTRDMTAWSASSSSSWAHGTGNNWFYNTSSAGGVPSDGAVTKIIDLNALTFNGEDKLRFNMVFNSWNGTTPDDIYVHLWGLVNNQGSTTTTSFANYGAQNGNMWIYPGNFSYYNLGSGVLMAVGGDQGQAANAAIQFIDHPGTGDANLVNADNHTTILDLSGHSVNTIAGYDYLVIGIARNPDVGTSNGLAIHDLSITAVPEMSHTALALALTALGALALRRRKV